jgi:L-iditol 2-dehydrogenase
MKAAICYGPSDIRIEDVPVREAGPEEVLVKVAYCGICPSDVRVYKGLSSQKTPCILGHEFTGVVEAKGVQVRDLEIGARVVVDPARKCYTGCPACRRGDMNKCVGMAGANDGFAEYHVTRAANVYPLKPSVDLVAASMTEPLACVLHGQNRARLFPGAVAVVVGAGPIGLLHIQAAKLAGARVVVSDLSRRRLDAAVDSGADYVVMPDKDDLKDVVMRASDGWGADSVMVAAGSSGVVEQSFELLGIGGTAVIFAGIYPNNPVAMNPNLVHYNEINITGASDYTDIDFVSALKLISEGFIDVKKLVSDIVPLEQTGRGMELVKSGTRLKVVIKIGGDS